MKIGLINFASMTYSVDTPYEKPLGGSESGLCYLAASLARRGHAVTLFGRLPNEFVSRGVRHLPERSLETMDLTEFEVLVVQNAPQNGLVLRKFAGEKVRLVLWSGHGVNQPSVQSLQHDQLKAVFDAFVFVSQAQLDSYLATYHLPPNKCHIIQNAISSVFENLVINKSSPPILAYTSVPYMGLELLIKLFPEIQKQIPEVTLKVFSSLAVYQTPKATDVKEYGQLYNLCRQTEGVEYIGSVSQPRLADELSKISILTYPSIYPDTSCICVMEAMAAGCQIITSNFGALPETTAGFAKLITVDVNYNQNFINATINALKNPTNTSKQIAFVRKNYTWKKRASQWENIFDNI